jgi:para-nitrobenzyl esterase
VANGGLVFKGIPFAAAPLGDLRWRAPQPVVPWTGVRIADTFGATCLQEPFPEGSPYASSGVTKDNPGSEDCLYLNVWTAAAAGERRPVMLWLHGGGWTRGSGNLPDVAAFVTKGVVLVSANYRLGVFGCLAHPELTAESAQRASGNYGILDQIAALKWVQKNIHGFGGDPSRVTIFGESAGSLSVNVVQATPLAKGLFHRAIGESGALFASTASLMATTESGGVAFAKAAGADSLRPLRGAAAETLLATPFRTGINVDGYVLPDTVRNLFAQKTHNAVPILVGSNADEWTTLGNPSQYPKTMEAYRQRVEGQYGVAVKDYDAAYPVRSTADITKVLLAVGRDNTFTLEMRTWARMVTAAGQPAFLYQFTRVPPGPNPAWGAYHSAEIEYVVNIVSARPWATGLDRRLAQQMSSYWVNFATTGDPNGKDLPRWTRYDAAAEPYLEFGDAVQGKNHLLKTQLDFLERFQQRRQP